MAVVRGYGGDVKVGENSVAEVRNWNADIQREELDATHMDPSGDGWREYETGLGSGTGSMDVNWDMTDTTGQKALQNAVLSPPATPPTIKLCIGANFYSGSIIVTNVSPSVGVDGLAEATINFRFTGAISFT